MGMGFSSEITKKVTPIEGIDWTFQTTRGFQNISNLMMSSETSSTNQISQVLFFNGILFNSFFEKTMFLKVHTNLGFKENMNFLWSNEIDIYHNNKFNENLRCIEVDTKMQFLEIIGVYGNLYPVVGYSFMRYTYDKWLTGFKSKTFIFHSFSVGLEFGNSVTKKIHQNYYVSISPLVLNNNGQKRYSALNYGAEVKFVLNPVSVTFLLAFRNGFNDKSKILQKNTYMYNASEVGFSFKVNLK